MDDEIDRRSAFDLFPTQAEHVQKPACKRLSLNRRDHYAGRYAVGDERFTIGRKLEAVPPLVARPALIVVRKANSAILRAPATAVADSAGTGAVRIVRGLRNMPCFASNSRTNPGVPIRYRIWS